MNHQMKSGIRLLCILLLLGNSLFAQERKKVFVPWFDVVNLKSEFKVVPAKVLRGYIEEQQRYEVVLPPYGDTVTGAWLDAPYLCKAAKEAGADYVVMGTLTRLSETVLVEVRMLDASSGSLQWTDKLKANTTDDLDPIMMRVGKTLGTSKVTNGTDDIYSVSSYDSKSLRKREANYSFGVGLGGLTLLNPSSDLMGGFSIAGSYDMRELIFDIKGSYYGIGAPDYDMYSFGIEILKPFRKTDYSPFISTGFLLVGYDYPVSQSTRTSVLNSEHTSGFLFQAGAGYMVNRLSSAHLRADINGLFGSLNGINGMVGGVQLRLQLLFSH